MLLMGHVFISVFSFVSLFHRGILLLTHFFVAESETLKNEKPWVCKHSSYNVK